MNSDSTYRLDGSYLVNPPAELDQLLLTTSKKITIGDHKPFNLDHVAHETQPIQEDPVDLQDLYLHKLF